MRKSVWIISILLVLAIIALCIFIFAKQPSPLPENSKSASLLQHGPYGVGTLNIEFVDTTRTTQSNKDFEGSPARYLPSTIWYPVMDDNRPSPLVIYSHGFSSMRLGAKYLAQHLASYGFVVVAADYPLTNYNAPGGAMARDIVNQPGDISFLINSMHRLNRDRAHVLFNLINTRTVGLVGRSLGGMVSTMAAYDPKRRDSRINAVVSIAGPTNMFDRNYFKHTRIPFLMIASNTDAIVDYKTNALPVLKNIDQSYLITLESASHTGWAQSSRWLRWMSNPDNFGCYIAQRNQKEAGEPWYHLIGSKAEGVIPNASQPACSDQEFDKAMNPVEQHWLTTLAVTNFLKMNLFTKKKTQNQARRFLFEAFPTENPKITIQSSEDAIKADTKND